ncbi:hypothetical protein R3P38DRAFT_2790974 [Favolaschia claudopus]|uniref:Uncharacterized protein n=1 Tax=Favolaschia claudopus TaxID=2862362 RepID=A0AAW0AHS5_9AGAR
MKAEDAPSAESTEKPNSSLLTALLLPSRAATHSRVVGDAQPRTSTPNTLSLARPASAVENARSWLASLCPVGAGDKDPVTTSSQRYIGLEENDRRTGNAESSREQAFVTGAAEMISAESTEKLNSSSLTEFLCPSCAAASYATGNAPAFEYTIQTNGPVRSSFPSTYTSPPSALCRVDAAWIVKLEGPPAQSRVKSPSPVYVNAGSVGFNALELRIDELTSSSKEMLLTKLSPFSLASSRLPLHNRAKPTMDESRIWNQRHACQSSGRAHLATDASTFDYQSSYTAGVLPPLNSLPLVPAMRGVVVTKGLVKLMTSRLGLSIWVNPARPSQAQTRAFWPQGTAAASGIKPFDLFDAGLRNKR